MTLKYLFALLAAFLFFPGNAPALNISLAQIDASGLLVTQKVQVYVSVTDDRGLPVEGLEPEAFKIAESPDGVNFETIQGISAFTPNAGAVAGITFLLLIDNSGSMYDTLDGKATTDPRDMRITHAKEAVRTLLSGMTNPNDRVGLGYFNTSWHLLSRPTADRDGIDALLDGIQRPTPGPGLHGTVCKPDPGRAGVRRHQRPQGDHRPLGRGELSVFEHAGKPHPVFGSPLFTFREPITANQEEGNTIYAVNFGTGSVPTGT